MGRRLVGHPCNTATATDYRSSVPAEKLEAREGATSIDAVPVPTPPWALVHGKHNWAAEWLNLSINECTLVAIHLWDLNARRGRRCTVGVAATQQGMTDVPDSPHPEAEDLAAFADRKP